MNERIFDFRFAIRELRASLARKRVPHFALIPRIPTSPFLRFQGKIANRKFNE